MLNFTRKEVENLLHFVEKEPAPQTSLNVKGIKESVLQLACLKYPHLITKVGTRVRAVSVRPSPAEAALLEGWFPPQDFRVTQATGAPLVLFLAQCVFLAERAMENSKTTVVCKFSELSSLLTWEADLGCLKPVLG